MTWPHHERAIAKWIEAVSPNPQVLAVIFAGSLTKGYGTEASDVDGFIVVTPEEYARQKATGDYFWWNAECCDYEGGYIDAKYIDVPTIELVAARGSEPARSAFIGAEVRWARVAGLEALCQAAAAFPEAGLADRLVRFRGQLEFGRWFMGEATRKGNPYLSHMAANRVILFGARMILAENRLLYPYHKWFLRTLATVPDLPEGLLEDMDALARRATPELADRVAEKVLGYRAWDTSANWANLAIRDSELNWLEHEPPIEDL